MYCFGELVFLPVFWVIFCPYLPHCALGRYQEVKLLGHRVCTRKNLLSTIKFPMLYIKYSPREYKYECIILF